MRWNHLIPWALLLASNGLVSAADSSSTESETSTTESKTPTKTSKSSSKTESESKTASATETGDSTKTESNRAKATHTIKVGSKEDPHQYSPSNIDAGVGDVVVFEFYPRNHSVVQAEYGAPCVPAEGDIFYSGRFDKFNEKNGHLVGDPPTWNLTINSTEPIFFYCTAIDSCIKNGMVGAINPNKTYSWESQFQKALKYPYMLVPGQPAPAEGDSPTSSPSASASASSTPEKKGGLGGGAIAGIVIGCVAFIAILGALFFVLGRNRVYRKWLTSEEGNNDRTRKWAMSGGGGGGWSSGPKSDASAIDGTTVASSHPNHMSFAGSEMNPSHMSGQFAKSPGTPGHFSWDGASAAHEPLGSPKLMNAPGARQELAAGPVELVELPAGILPPGTPTLPQSPPQPKSPGPHNV